MVIEMTDIPPSREELLKRGYMTAPQLAAYLGLSVRTIRVYVKKGKLSPTEIGYNCHLFSPSEIGRLIRNA